MEEVVRRLEMIIEEAETAPAKAGDKIGPRVLSKKREIELLSPWKSSSKVATAFETFTSRIEDPELRTKIGELCKLVEGDLGSKATNPLTGVYNAPRLLRFLYSTEMNVGDARTQIVLNSNARLEYKMDAKREHIVTGDLSYDRLPRWAELQKYQPTNQLIGRGRDGSAISYINFGSNLAAMKEAFTVEEYIDSMSCCYREARTSTALLMKSLAFPFSQLSIMVQCSCHVRSGALASPL